MEIDEETGAEVPIARGLVYRDKKLFHKRYGDVELLGYFLRKRGYKQGSFNGARLNLIKINSLFERRDRLNSKIYLCPFLDPTVNEDDRDYRTPSVYLSPDEKKLIWVEGKMSHSRWGDNYENAFVDFAA